MGTTWKQANREHRCLVCGTPEARLLRLPDGRNVRACDECLRGTAEPWLCGAEREPLPCEIRPPEQQGLPHV